MLPVGVLVWVIHCGLAAAAEAGPWLTAHVPGATLGVGKGEKCLYHSQDGCASVIQQQTPSWTQKQLDAPCWSKNIRQVESMGMGGMWDARAMRM